MQHETLDFIASSRVYSRSHFTWQSVSVCSWTFSRHGIQKSPTFRSPAAVRRETDVTAEIRSNTMISPRGVNIGLLMTRVDGYRSRFVILKEVTYSEVCFHMYVQCQSGRTCSSISELLCLTASLFLGVGF